MSQLSLVIVDTIFNHLPVCNKLKPLDFRLRLRGLGGSSKVKDREMMPISQADKCRIPAIVQELPSMTIPFISPTQFSVSVGHDYSIHPSQVGFCPLSVKRSRHTLNQTSSLNALRAVPYLTAL